MIKVAFLIPGFGDGGAQRQAILLMNALQKRDDVEMHLLYIYEDVHFSLLDQTNVKLHKLNVKGNYDLRIPFMASHYLRTIGIDVLVTWLISSDVFGYAIKLLSPRTRWVLTERNSQYPSGWKTSLRDIFGLHADAIVANSQKGLLYWKSLGFKQIVKKIDNILPPNNQINVGSNSEQNTVIYVGRLEKNKNVLTMARAFCLTARHFPNWNFQIVGKGSLSSKILEIIQTEGAGAQVALLGFRTDVRDMLAQAKVQVSLSHHEGLPNTLMEGASAGKTIVASAIDEHIEFLGADYPYLIEDFETPDSCAEYLVEAMIAPKNIELLKFAKERLQSMDSNSISRSYFEIFKELKGGNSEMDVI